MTIPMERLIPALHIAAIRWWKAKRPPDMLLVEHLLQPTINCTTDAEIELALVVAGLLTDDLGRRGSARDDVAGL
jgi:hypothetical protein